MDADDVVSDQSAYNALAGYGFLLNAFVRRVNRRLGMRMVRSARSILPALTCFGSGLLVRVCLRLPTHSERLYLFNLRARFMVG